MLVTIEDALNLIKTNVTAVSSEILPIESAIGRISSLEHFATHALPRFTNSAMDGFAVKCEDAGKSVKVVSTILAGDSSQPSFSSSQAVRIMTGARVPSDAEAVIPIENVEIDGELVTLPSDIKNNMNIRFKGEDIAIGDKVLSIGEEITSAVIAILASQGITHVEVYRLPRVAVFATGEELKLHHETIEDHQIYNSNTPYLISRAKELGCEVSFLGGAKDNLESIQSMVRNSKDADLIITSGGVSVGDADFTKEAFLNEGVEYIFDKIDVKPGKPTVLGKINNTMVLNLPGNPLASALIFEYFGRVLVNCLQGCNDNRIQRIHTIMGNDYKQSQKKNTIIPGWFDGNNFKVADKRSPGMVGVLAKCNAIALVKKDLDGIKAGEKVEITTFKSF